MALDFCPLGPYSLTMMNKAAAKFLYEVGMLKKTPRTGYRFLGSGEESVAEHSFRTAVIGYVRTFCGSKAWPRGELNFPRAIVTEKAFPEDEFLFITSASTGSPGEVGYKAIYEKRIVTWEEVAGG